MKSITFEAKSLDEAKKHAEQELRVNRKYITFDTEERRGMLGLKKTLSVTAKVDVDLLKIGEETLQDMFENMGIEASVKASNPTDNEFTYEIDSNENPVLIGKNGKTLDNIQFYMRNLLNLFSDERVIVLVDVGGYKANRKKQLEILATKTAKEVAKTKVEVKLDPMNAYERRIIHTKLADWRDVVTKSEGESNNRYLVIKPKK